MRVKAGSLILIVVSLLCVGRPARAEALDVGDRTQLFIDDRFMAESQGMTLRVNPPVKAGPAIQPDKPWEAGEIGFCVSVAKDADEYKIWYLAHDAANAYHVCYARSADGITWEKPKLGLIEYGGSKDNNIVMAGVVETTVFIDPVAEASKRFKAVAAMHWPDPKKAGLYVWTSPDGLRWTCGPRVLPFLPDTANQAFYDTRLKKYVANIRVWAPLRMVGRVEMEDILKPWPYQPLDKPYFIWGTDKIAVPSREVPIVFAYDQRDPVPSDHYNAACIQYPWAADAYFMFPSAYRHYPEPPVGKWGNDGLVDIQMAVSRDGVHWSRPTREPYVPMGMEGTLDCGQLYMAVGIVRSGDAIFQYYGGYRNTHGAPAGTHGGGICRLLQRPDGFLSADAAYDGGQFTTPVLRFSGNRLVLNVDGSALGTGKVALLDASGKEIPGFGLAQCDQIEGNSVRKVVHWKGQSDLGSLRGKEVRLGFSMRAMKLFSFRFASSDEDRRQLRRSSGAQPPWASGLVVR